MYRSLKILLIGRTQEAISRVEKALAQQRMISLAPLVAGNGHLKIPGDMHPAPDALMFCLDETWSESFWQVIGGLPLSGHPSFVVSPTNDLQLLRIAMRYGIRDVFVWPINAEDVVSAVTNVVEQERARHGGPSARLISFMNAKGGSGASFLAASVAQVIADKARLDRRAILVDLDFQFGGLPVYLNMNARDGLIQALELVDSLDEMALSGYVKVHESGLHLLASAMDELILPEDLGAERTEKLLTVLGREYEDIIVDLPRRIDTAVSAVARRSDLIVLVAQQTVPDLHDTRRLYFLLRDLLGIAEQRMRLLVNRFNKKAQVQVEDFSKALPNLRIEVVPEDSARVVESVNLGISVCATAPRSPLGKRLIELAEAFDSPVPVVLHKSAGLFEWLRRSESR